MNQQLADQLKQAINYSFSEVEGSYETLTTRERKIFSANDFSRLEIWLNGDVNDKFPIDLESKCRQWLKMYLPKNAGNYENNFLKEGITPELIKWASA